MILKRQSARRKKPFRSRVLGRLTALPKSVIAAVAVAVIIPLVLAALAFPFPELGDGFWKGLYVEAGGILFDLMLFGVWIELVRHWHGQKEIIERHQEVIQDFKHWNTEEGRLRIAGAIRRLARLKKTDLDFSGIMISDFSFKLNDIESIQGSKFYEGQWGTYSSREEVHLQNVDFSFLDCSKVIFSAFNPFEGLSLKPPVQIVDCTFCGADLRGSIFNGALLEWTKPPPENIVECVDDDGVPELYQTIHPPFEGADLFGTSFRNARFKNADFREAKNILKADFSGAKGLETCVFDDNAVKTAIFKKARATAG